MAAELSVVLALRNVAAHLPDMLESLRRNERPGLQLVAVDDASDDDTPQLLADADLPGLQVIRTEAPVGVGQQLGLREVTGRLVTFLDGDDWLLPGYFDTLVEAIDGLGCDVVRTDHVQVRGRNRELHRAPGEHGRVLDPRDSINPYSRETMVDYPFTWAGIYRASLGDVLRFEDGLHTATDRPWVWRLHREARSFAVIPYAGLFYRREVSGSLTTIGDERRLHLFDAYRHVFDQLRDEPQYQPKAVRQFLGLLARHVSMADVYDAEPRRRFDERARAAVAALDPALVERVMLPDDRRRLIEPYLPPALTATGR